MSSVTLGRQLAGRRLRSVRYQTPDCMTSSLLYTMNPMIELLTAPAGALLPLPTAPASQVRLSSQVTAVQSSTGPYFTKSQAVQLIERLTVEERTIFLRELRKVADSGKTGSTVRPTRPELFQLAYHNSLPFVGFGFLDNFVMIVAGEYIDLTLGVTLGISTMAAAALGNTISDMMGIGSAWYVETWATRLGAIPPDLTPGQLELPSSRLAANLGRCLGVMVGCLLGMLPLLFIKTEEQHPSEDENSKTADSSGLTVSSSSRTADGSKSREAGT